MKLEVSCLVFEFRTTLFRELVPGSILDKDDDDGPLDFGCKVWSEELFEQDFSAQNGRHSRPESFRHRQTNRAEFDAARDRIERYQKADEFDYQMALIKIKTAARTASAHN